MLTKAVTDPVQPNNLNTPLALKQGITQHVIILPGPIGIRANAIPSNTLRCSVTVPQCIIHYTFPSPFKVSVHK